MFALTIALVAMAAGADEALSAQVNPVPRTIVTSLLLEWSFDRDTEGWQAANQCELQAAEGKLRVRSTGEDPYLVRQVDLPAGEYIVQLRARSRTDGHGAIYWATDRSPQMSEQRSAHFQMQHDGQWHEYAVRLAADGKVTALRLDPGTAPGEIEIDHIRLLNVGRHPLAIEKVAVLTDRVQAVVRNHGQRPMEFTSGGKLFRLPAGGEVTVEQPLAADTPLEVVKLELQCVGWPPVVRTVMVHHPQVQTQWLELRLKPARPQPKEAAAPDEKQTPQPSGPLLVRLAADGSVGRIFWQGRLVGLIGPLVHFEGRLPKLTATASAHEAILEGDGVRVSLELVGDLLVFSIHSQQPCEGPVVRALGGLEGGLFAGLEYLGKGEQSSSALDIETDDRLRFAPDPMKVTMPLMALVTDAASLALTWDDMDLQPVYATPNFFDGTGDHRMALRGKRIAATLRVCREPLESLILWAVNRRGLPPLPKPPRSSQEQYRLCLTALGGPLRNDQGWGHCVEPNWPRQPFADMASTVFRLSGEIPELPTLVPGGAHVPNGTIYFVTGRAEQWLAQQRKHIRHIINGQRQDGSFRYDGPFRRGHYEDTASGHCARPAAELLEFARITGDREALKAGLHTLEYMKRFRVPRGAQTWELSLHTPDQLASAYLVWAYVRGYELTGRREYLDEARRWAASGIPFTYLWGNQPVMVYATVPVYGATNYRWPVWIGLPVQWVGGVYAYALTMLAPYDKSVDWQHLAWGILISAEQQQYPDGPHAGLLPDSFALRTQQRHGPNINPCAIASLRMVLEGKVDFLSVAADGKHRVAAPFPVTIGDGIARIRAKAGLKYQVLIDGKRIVEVHSRGEDTIRLAAD